MNSSSRRPLHGCLFHAGGASLILEVARSGTLSLSLGNTQQATVAFILARAHVPDTRVLYDRKGKSATVTVLKEWLETWMGADEKSSASTSDSDMHRRRIR